MLRARALLLLLPLEGCAARGAEPAPPAPVPAPSVPLAVASTAPLPVEAPPTPTLLLTDPPLMAALERRGLSLGAVLGASADGSNDELATLPSFAPVVRDLQRELTDVAARDPAAGVDVARFSHRLFDERFLRRKEARFALAGVVNRPDRAPFAAASCGEVRLIYRLQYAFDAERASKLPMTLGVELTVPREADGCRAAAARWLEPASDGVDARADRLRSPTGPLSSDRVRLAPERTRLVVNVQLVRWPSTVRPDLGGHAEYLLRAYRPDERGVLRSERLENTVEPSQLRSAEERRALTRWLSESFASVDAGTPLVPSEFLATRALSVTPRGLQRLANRPFSASAPRDSELVERGDVIQSAEGFKRRLDQLSCPGCHQARSVAGFHLLGEDAADNPPENSLALPASPHLLAELPRRLRIARQMLNGEEPSFTAPFAERAGEHGAYGDACSLGEDPTFAAWGCAAGLRCVGEASGLGQCLPETRGVGDACETGSVSPSTDRLRDRMRGVRVESCPDMVCNRSGVGFPGGMCTASCGAKGSGCGAIALLEPFNACLARGESFLTCVRGNVQPAGLRRCDAESPCRDDYVCAKAPKGSGGVCLPPYFVFQLRVDGHSVAARKVPR